MKCFYESLSAGLKEPVTDYSTGKLEIVSCYAFYYASLTNLISHLVGWVRTHFEEKTVGNSLLTAISAATHAQARELLAIKKNSWGTAIRPEWVNTNYTNYVCQNVFHVNGFFASRNCGVCTYMQITKMCFLSAMLFFKVHHFLKWTIILPVASTQQANAGSMNLDGLQNPQNDLCSRRALKPQ